MKESFLFVANYGAQTGYAWSNIYRLFGAIAAELHRRGVGIVVSVADTSYYSSIVGDVEHEWFRFVPRQSDLSSLLRLRRNIKRLNVKYVYFTDQATWRPLYLLLRFWGVRLIIVHNRISVREHTPAVPEKGLRRYFKTSVNRLPWITADQILAVSNFVRHRLLVKNCFPGRRVHTVLNGVDVERWYCGPKEHSGIDVVIFAAARATQQKGIQVLIQAASILYCELGIRNFRVDFAGAGPDLSDFKKLVSELQLEEVVSFLGRLEDTRDRLCKADIFVVPSMYGDACPSTVSEALASNRPLVTTIAGGIPELVGSEENAKLVIPGDSRQLAWALRDLIADPDLRDELSKRGRERACSALRAERYHAQTIEKIQKWCNL